MLGGKWKQHFGSVSADGSTGGQDAAVCNSPSSVSAVNKLSKDIFYSRKRPFASVQARLEASDTFGLNMTILEM